MFDNTPPLDTESLETDDWTRGFWEAASEEQLAAAKCARCGVFRMPPGRFCRSCGSQDYEWAALPGTGTVFTCTVVRSGTPPYVPAVIDPDGAEGVRFISAIVNCNPDQVRPGMRVRAVFDRITDTLAVPYWAPE